METGYTAKAAEDREQLILQHLPQVQWIASCLHERLRSAVDQEDLVSAGLVGLIAAIDNFNPAYNTSLRTYAEYKIRGAILDSIRGLDGIPPHKRKRLRQVQQASAALSQRLMQEPTEEEMAGELGIQVAEYHEWLDELKGVSLGSLDTVTSEECDGGLLRYIADDRDEAFDTAIERRQLQALLAEGIAAMPATEQTVLDLYFYHELTLSEIGRVMDLHTSRICQLKTQAIVRLRTWIERRLKPKGTQT
jgi:RNA polymerase sigma factor for flagellar operon FliA